ncbi:hypothetical protein VNO78_03172 [Psophocarpus tetragonolobus]|uniref:Uncharacterized protein n=1 Tax=Psophocarpus tetragonolobus TaxID=3891 RepID=A0AAN9XWQ4_PSOTE
MIPERLRGGSRVVRRKPRCLPGPANLPVVPTLPRRTIGDRVLNGRPDRGGDRVSRAQIAAAIAPRAPRSRQRSRLARPDRGGDRVFVDRPDRVAAEIVSTAASAALRRVSTAQIPSDLGASALINRVARSSGSSSRFRRPFQRFSTAFSSQIQTDLGVSAPPGLPAPPPSRAGFPSALVRRPSSREGGNTAGAGSAQEPFPIIEGTAVDEIGVVVGGGGNGEAAAEEVMESL